jgi:hypothetical protein
MDDLGSAIVTALAVDLGGGTDPGLDLSASGVVLRGAYARPPRLPFVAVDGVSVDGTRREATTLRHWRWTISWSVIAWIPVETLTTEARVLRAEEAMAAILDALTTAASTPGNALYGVIEPTFTAVSVDSSLAEAPEQAAVVGITVTAITHRTGGP